MYRAGDSDKKVESKLYLRYNCDNGMLYVMVATVDGVVLAANGDNFVKIDGDKKVGSPDIGNYTQSADNMGWEASFALAEGTYDLDVHTQVTDDGSQTSALAGRSAVLTIACPEATVAPTTAPPTEAPTTAPPTVAPTTAPPTVAPTTAPPTVAPTGGVLPTEAPAAVMASILIAKSDNRGTTNPNDDVMLDGASFEVYRDDGDEAFDAGDELVMPATPTDRGLLDTDLLDAGWYWIVESVVPAGYVGSDPILVQLNTDDAITCIWDAAGLIECDDNVGNVRELSWTIVLVDNTPVGEAPTGGVGGATGTPGAPGLTLPPTDTLSGGTSVPAGDGWRLILLAMAGLMAAALLVTPARVVVRKDDRNR